VRFVLVHSPAVGPVTWRWVASVLESWGHEAVVPDLREAAMTGNPRAFGEAAAEAAVGHEHTVVVGHSAAGSLLPVIASRKRNVRRLVFVDATIPPCEGSCTAGGDFLPALRGLATDGVLPVWSHWWGADVLRAVVREDDRRHEIEKELPTLPLAFFEAPITLPAGWCASDGGFLLFSEFYRSDAVRAAELGWPVVERPGAHLEMVNDERTIAGMLVDLGR
jgi:hypothetical protein